MRLLKSIDISIAHFGEKCKRKILRQGWGGSDGSWCDIIIGMIKIIAGGKKNAGWVAEACAEYEKRLRKPYEISWVFMEEEKLIRRLHEWPFVRGKEYVICCDERGKNISSGEYSDLLSRAFTGGCEVVILIGGAYGFDDYVREKADFVWSFSKLVFPHGIARVVAAEQIYRASQIAIGGPYHHE